MLVKETAKRSSRKVYLNVKEGAIVRRTDSGEERYSYVEGLLESITTREREFRGERVIYWYIDMRDRDSGELYSIGFPYGSNVFKSVILSLASYEALTRKTLVRISPYMANGYDKVSVICDAIKTSWVVKELPPVEVVEIGGKKVKDDSQRMKLICSYCDLIIGRLDGTASQPIRRT